MSKVGMRRPSPAMVVAVIALIVALAGSAYAATKIGTSDLKNKAVTKAKIRNKAVTTSKLANQAVTEGKLADAAVTTDKIADGAVNGAKVLDGSLNAQEIDQGSLTGVKAANVFGSISAANGALIRATDPGITGGGCFIVCPVSYPRDITDCTYTASTASGGTSVTTTPNIVEVARSDTNTVQVFQEDNAGGLTSGPFSVTTICP